MAYRIVIAALMVVTTVVVFSLVATGCERVPEADVVFVSTSEHNDWDPQQISWLHDGRMADHLFEPLLHYNSETGRTDEGVAESWEISEDGRTYTFHLRTDARWSNGDAVTAGDFVYAWRRAIMPDSAANYSKLLLNHIEGAPDFYAWREEQLAEFEQVREVAGGEAGEAADEAAEQVWEMTLERFEEMVGIAAVDDYTLEVRLKRPTPYFLSLVSFVTFMPVHEASVEEATRTDAETGARQTSSSYWSDPERLVSNGPYRLAARRFREYVLLEANEEYWNAESVTNASLLERIITDQQNAMTEYRRGRIDIWPGVPSGRMAAELVRSEDREDVHSQTMAGVYFYNFNSSPELSGGRENPLADERVRRAFAKAIDRETLVERVTQLNQPVARSYVPEEVIAGYAPPVERGVRFDPEGARELLAEAGHAEGEGLGGLSILYNTGAEHGPIAEAIASMWEEHLNVRVSLEGVEVGTFRDRMESQDYTICRASWFGDYPDPTTWLDRMMTDDGNNHTGWGNAQFDELVREAREEQDEQRRFELLREAEGILLDEQPMALIFQYRFVNLWDPERVSGVQTNAWAQWRFGQVEVEGSRGMLGE